MEEIVDGVWHWSTLHEGIGHPVHSYLVVDGEEGIVIDPRVPDGGIDRLAEAARPAHALLTNRHHYRHSGQLHEQHGTTVWCHRNGMHEFTGGEEVEAFEFGQALPGRFVALEVGVLCPEETALHHRERRLLALGDSVIREDGELAFVPDVHMGDDPEAVKDGLRAALRGLLDRDFAHLLLAHGDPVVGGGKEVLRAFVRE